MMNGIVNLPNTFLDFSNKFNTLQDSAASDMQREKSVAFLSKGDENNDGDESPLLDIFFNRHKSLDDDRQQVANISPPIQNYLALASERSSFVTAPSSVVISAKRSPPAASSASVLATLSTSLSSTVRVFNPEAFCELCQKEFCNKYYLQTHRATKHGILPTSLGAASSNVVGPSAPVVASTSNSNNNNTNNNHHNSSNTSSTAHNRSALSSLQSSHSSSGEFTSNPNSNSTAVAAAAADVSSCAPGDDEPMMQNLASAFPSTFLSQLQQQQQPTNQSQMELQQMLLAASVDQSNLQNLYINQLAQMAGMQSGNDNSSMVSPSPATPVTSVPLPVSSTSADSPVIDRSQLSSSTSAESGDLSSLLAQLMANPMALQNAAPSIPSSTTPSLLEQMQIMAAQNMLSQSGNTTVLANVLTQANQQQQQTLVSNGAGNPGNQTPTALATPTKEKDKDTYCDLCNKNFCTKSFLKKHRQQQHPETFSSPLKAFAQNAAPTPNNFESILAKLPSVIVNNSQAAVAAEKTEPAPTLKMEVHDSMKPMIKQMRLGDSGIKAKPSHMECDICSKPCNDIVSLLTHKAQEHPETLTTMNASKDMFDFSDHLTNAAIKSEVVEEKVTCEICDKEFKSQQYLDLHKKQQHTTKPQPQMPQHQNMNLLGMLPQGFSPFLLPGIGQLQLGELDQATAAALATSLSQNNNGTPQVQPTTPKSAKRTYSSSGKNYCDLCNKEVCNKYFLRTHMLKMHKIVIDENKTVIANIDTLEREKNGSLSFRCDQCFTELKSRSLLKAHKQEAHGIPPQPAQAVGSQPRTPKHSTSSTPAQLTSLAQIHEQNSMRSESGLGEKMPCPLCSVPLAQADMFEHLFTAHQTEITNNSSEVMEVFRKASIASIPESTASSTDVDQFQPQTSMPSVDDVEANESGEFKCDMCPYKSRHSANLQMHVQNHDAMKVSPGLAAPTLPFANGFQVEDDDEAMRATTEVALKMVQQNEMISSRVTCNLCHRPFSSKEALQTHMGRIHFAKRVHSVRHPQKSVLRKTKYSMKKSFVCTKCHQRFASRHECFSHALVHTRRPNPSATVVGETKLEVENNGLDAFIREESGELSGVQFADQLHRPHSNGQKEERNSHTSGSISPLSMQTMPEGFAQPGSLGDKCFSMQSFIMREKGHGDSNGMKNAFPNELVAHLPVRSLINDTVSITFDITPAPQIDSRVYTI